MDADDLKVAEAMKAHAKKELMTLHELTKWLLKHWDAPEFEDIYKLKEADGTFEYIPIAIQKILVDLVKQDEATALSVMLNIDEIIEEIKEDCD